MALTDNPQPFRFMDLPGELRNNIYALLLRPVEYEIADVGEDRYGYRRKPAESFTNGAILRTSRQIHREAHDAMVKANKFVWLRSWGNIPLRMLLKAHHTSIVTTDEVRISQFKGYALEIELLSDKRLEPRYMPTTDVDMAPMSVMMLAKDLDSLCESLSRAERHVLGFSLAVTIILTVASALNPETESDHLPSSLLVTETIQARLLQPFRRHLRGFKKSRVWGDVAPEIVQALRDDIATDECTNPAELVSEIKMKKKCGQDIFQEGKYEIAFPIWHEATYTIDRLHYSSSWPILTERGGQPFTNDIAHLQFLLHLNLGQLALKSHGPMSRIIGLSSLGIVSLALAGECTNMGYWSEGYKYNLSPMHLAKLQYRQAVSMRLWGPQAMAKEALGLLRQAHAASPDDTAIDLEVGRMLIWAMSGDRSGGPYA